MLTPNLPDSDTLILDQLDIPGKTGPVSESPKVWGINIAAALGNFPRQGLLCRAGPWTSMGIGDQIKVFWNKDVEVLQKTVGPADVNTTLQMFVPSARIPEGRAAGYYSVKRLGQAWEPSEDMQVLVKLTRPGGHDDNNDPGHSKLIMRIPQEIISGGIDKDNVDKGVSITIEPYPNIAAGDVIQLSWGGVFVLSAPLTQEQAEGKVPLVVHVSGAVIREAGDSDGIGLSVAFEVYDAVENRSEDWCAPQRVVVSVDATRLLAPILEQAHNNTLDLDTLGDANGKALIWAITEQGFEVGDTIVLRFKGTPSEGAPVDIEISGKPLTNVPSTDQIEIDNALLRQLAKAQIALSYYVRKHSGGADLLSKTQFINVIGELQRLAAPIALDAIQGALDPQLKTVRIEIPFDASFAEGQVIKLFWLGTRPDLTPFLPDLPLHFITKGNVDDKLPIKINVDSAHLTPIIGGTLELFYQLQIPDDLLGKMNPFNAIHAIRESIHADVLQVGEPRRELPKPEVAGVDNGALPADIDGTTLVVPYRNTDKNDLVTYEWKGSIAGLATDSIKLSSLTAGQPVPFPIEAKHIKGNEGGTVRASYFIQRALGGTSYSDTLEFNVGAGLVTPVITSVKDSKDVAIPHNGLTVDTSVKLSGTATPNLDILIFNNGVSTGGRATADAQGNWTRNVSGLPLGERNLTAVAQYGSGPVSAVWKIIVTAMMTPTITSIKDSKGLEIPQGGTTGDTSVTITGTASKGQRVDVLDDITSKDKPTAHPLTGIWTSKVSGLSITTHSFTAKALYGAGPASPARTFTVTSNSSRTEDWEGLPVGDIPFDALTALPSGALLIVRALAGNVAPATIYTVDSEPQLGKLIALGGLTVTEFAILPTSKSLTIEYHANANNLNEVVFYDSKIEIIHRETFKLQHWGPSFIKFEHEKECFVFRITTHDKEYLAINNITWIF
jgi:hypothetical protein